MERRNPLLFAAVCVSAAIASACGSSTTLASQLAPSGSTTLASLTIAVNPPSVGGGIQAGATATFSNGATSPVASGFTSDTPSVATVTNGGAVTGVAIGDATISVDYQGMRASKKIHVLPSYSGTFVGTYSVANCTETGGFVNTDSTQDFCTGAVGLVGAIAIQSTQSADLTAVTGLFQLSSNTGPLGNGTGTVSASGVLTYTGGTALAGSTRRLDFSNFAITSPAPGRIAGSFDMVFTDSAASGQAVLNCSNLDMTRQSLTAALTTVSRSVTTDLPGTVLGRILRR